MSGSRTPASRPAGPSGFAGQGTTGPRTEFYRTAGPSTTGARGAGPICTVGQGRPVCECVCPEHIMPSAQWGAPADFQTFLRPHRTQEVVETKSNGTVGNVLILGLAIAMLIIGNYFYFILKQSVQPIQFHFATQFCDF